MVVIAVSQLSPDDNEYCFYRNTSIPTPLVLSSEYDDTPCIEDDLARVIDESIEAGIEYVEYRGHKIYLTYREDY